MTQGSLYFVTLQPADHISRDDIMKSLVVSESRLDYKEILEIFANNNGIHIIEWKDCDYSSPDAAASCSFKENRYTLALWSISQIVPIH